MKKIILLVCLIVLTSGCATMWQKDNTVIQDFPQLHYKNYKIEIISEPSGAKIEINGNYVGVTPLRYIIDGSMGYLASFDIVAYPISQGQYVQRKHFSLGDMVPRRIYFNMDLVPIPQSTINVNVNQQPPRDAIWVVTDGVPTDEKLIKEVGENTVGAINKLDDSITKLNKSTSRANNIMIWLTIFMIVLTIAIFKLTWVMVNKP